MLFAWDEKYDSDGVQINASALSNCSMWESTLLM